jgi:hypothetical protein
LENLYQCGCLKQLLKIPPHLPLPLMPFGKSRGEN